MRPPLRQPRIATHDEFTSIVRDAYRFNSGDPIARLYEDLEQTGRPSLAWMIEWQERAPGVDPVRAAWDVSLDGRAMISLIYGKRVRNYALRDNCAWVTFESGLTIDIEVAHPHGWNLAYNEKATADAIRKAFPNGPPVLDELMKRGVDP